MAVLDCPRPHSGVNWNRTLQVGSNNLAEFVCNYLRGLTRIEASFRELSSVEYSTKSVQLALPLHKLQKSFLGVRNVQLTPKRLASNR